MNILKRLFSKRQEKSDKVLLSIAVKEDDRISIEYACEEDFEARFAEIIFAMSNSALLPTILNIVQQTMDEDRFSIICDIIEELAIMQQENSMEDDDDVIKPSEVLQRQTGAR